MTMTGNNKARLIRGASESCADLLYAVPVMVPDAFTWVQTENEELVIISALEVGRLRQAVSSETRVLSVSEAAREFGLSSASSPSEVQLITALARQKAVDRFDVPADFPLKLADELRAQGVMLQPQSPFCPQRAIKTAAETAAIGEGLRLAEAAIEKAVAILKESEIASDGITLQLRGNVLTAEYLRGEINAEVARLGGTASHTITAGGKCAADPHNSGSGPLPAHQPIIIDVFPRVDSHGYHGDMTRTLVKGEASELVQRAFKAVCQAQQQARQKLKPGSTYKDVHAAARTVFDQEGFSTETDRRRPQGFIHGVGHGLGLELHEMPHVNSTNEHTVQSGHVLTIEPGLYYPEWGGVRVEDVFEVTDAGAQKLSRAPVFLQIPAN